jgi:hypothetical protein
MALSMYQLSHLSELCPQHNQPLNGLLLFVSVKLDSFSTALVNTEYYLFLLLSIVRKTIFSIKVYVTS